MKIYTRGGDKGQTSLFSGERVSKASPLVHAYGTVDELNSIIGIVRSLHRKPDHLAEILYQVQNDLFGACADLASGEAEAKFISNETIASYEGCIDDLNTRLVELTNFIMPSGHPVAAHLHHARTVCRRAERLVVAAAKEIKLDRVLIRYLNRLADLLFVMAREGNRAHGEREEYWGKEEEAEDEGKSATDLLTQ